MKKEVEDKERAYNDEFCLRKEWQTKYQELLKELKESRNTINRQKEEIERLNAVSEICGECHKKYAEKIERAKSETIKKFAEKIKRKATIVHTTRSGIHYYEIDDNEIDSIIKEME